MKNSWLFPYRPFDVVAFLRRVNSPRLTDTPDFAAWIDAAARGANLRAEWLLGLAQKEQSFITRKANGSGWRRALDWTMGFGATEGGDLPGYAGTRNQVFAAARGLRRYMTPGDSLYCGNRVGKSWRDLDGNAGTIRNLAEACALQYTPHWSTLQTVDRIWKDFGFTDEGGEGMPTTEDVARIAREVCAMFATGYRGNMTINGISFELSDVAYCSEFVRECACAAAKEPAFGAFQRRYFGADARESERLMKRNAEAVTEAQAVPGDVVCFNAGNAGKWGHIGIYLGGGQFAENTSSTSRGPGFVISTFAQIGRNRISGFYHLPEFTRDTGAKIARLVVVLPGHENTMVPIMHEGTHYVAVRDVAAAFGCVLHDRRDTDGKLYLKPIAIEEAAP